MNTDPDDRSEEPFDVLLEPRHLAGVWANATAVTQGEHEFTLDFIRLDFRTRRGIVVARVAVAPFFVARLIETLQAEWRRYERRAMPSEVYADEDEDQSDRQES